MRKDDWHWHCNCDKKPLSDFALWVRKHKAEEAVEELAQRESEAQLRSEEREETVNRLSRKRKAQEQEIHLVNSVTTRLIDGPRLRGTADVRRKLARLKHSFSNSAVKAAVSSYTSPSFLSMGGALSTVTFTMGTSVKHFLSRVGLQRKRIPRPLALTAHC
jgi:hypothetical protein